MESIIDLLNNLDLPLIWRNFIVAAAALIVYLVSRFIKSRLNR